MRDLDVLRIGREGSREGRRESRRIGDEHESG